MADFYVNYGSKGAKLIASYKCGNVNAKLHQINTCKYVLSKNRKIVFEHYNVDRALAAFHNLIFLEAPDLLNN